MPVPPARRRAGLALLLLLVPLAYLAAVWSLQPADHLGDPPAAPWLGRLFYDDYDSTARALRGLNAELGRPAGQLGHPPDLDGDEFTRALQAPAELRPTYYLEYPHAALLLFRLGFTFQPHDELAAAPPALLDGLHNNVVEHTPQNAGERSVYRRLRVATCVYEAMMVAALLSLLAVLAVGYEPGGGLSGVAALLLLPAGLYFAVQRFDVVPALLTALSLACLGRKRVAASAGFLALATLVKVYPVVLAPVLFRYLWADRRAAGWWAAAYFGALAGGIGLTAACCGWAATVAPYRVQLSRPPEFDLPAWMPALPELGANGHLLVSVVRNGLLLAVVAALCYRPIADLPGVLRRGALAVLAFLALQVFYSPQWILWLAPLLLPLARPHRAVLWLYVVFDLVTYLSFPVVADLPDPSPFVAGPPVWVRLGVWAVLAWVLARAEFRRAARSAAGTPAGEAALTPELIR